MGITLLTLLIVAAGVIGYLHFSTRKEEDETSSESLPPFNPNPEGLNPPSSQPTEPDYIFLFAGNTIDREGKHFEWNYQLNKYEEKPLSVNIIASETVNVQNNEIINTVTTTVESQITDAVTVKPTKPKRKRGRKPTKKVKK